MARLLRVEYEGAIYHVTLRGNGRADIFHDKQDRERFLTRLGEKTGEYGIRLYLYCLMTNHVHLLLETPQGNLSRFMHALETAYTVYFNLRHDSSGHVLQGRYGARLVEGEEYLLKLTRYLHLNPVYVGGLKGSPLAERLVRLRNYPWSSYRGYVGLAQPESFVESGPVLRMVAKSETRQRREYREFVEAGLARTDEEFLAVMTSSRWGIGGEEFCHWVRDRHYDMVYGSGKKVEDAAFRKAVRTLKPDDVATVVAEGLGRGREYVEGRHRDGRVRPAVALMLCKYAGLTQRQAAERLGMKTGVAVSHQISRLKIRLENDNELRAKLHRIDSTLANRLKSTMYYGKG